MSDVLRAGRDYRAGHGWKILAMFADLLRLENVTRDVPALQRNAAAIVDLFQARGARMEVVQRDGAAPLIAGSLATQTGEPARTLGVYVHYDGQPVNPEQWRTPPFEPRLRTFPQGDPVPFPRPGEPIDDEWRLYARAAADDKTPLVALLAAIDALAEAGVPRSVNLVFCFEGEEESGSTHLRGYLEALRDRLRADAWLICDGPVYQSGAPQVVLGVRGFCGFELTVYGPERELHSGHYGNWVQNPALELARVLASFKDAHGRVAIDGFYDWTRSPSPAQRAALAGLPPIEDDLLARLGVAAPEVPGTRLVDRLMEPSLNVRGLAAASVGAAARNVIPASASASVDIRLAAGDDPEHMLDLVRAHLRGLGYLVLDRAPTLEERRAHRLLARLDGDVGYPAARTDAAEPIVAHLLAAATAAAGRTAIAMPTLGGSVPLHHFAEVLDGPTVIMPIANADNNQHAADENIRLGNLWYGMDLYGVLLTSPW